MNIKNILLDCYPNNNYYFLTVNIGDHQFVTDNHINIINNRQDVVTLPNGEIVCSLWIQPVIHFFKKYLQCTNTGTDINIDG